MQSPSCSVVVLNFRGLENLNSCLTSIKHQTYPHETYVIDYGGDGSRLFVKTMFPRFKIIHMNEDKYGPTGGFNYALKQIKSDYVLMLANDIKLKSDVLTKLMETITLKDDIGIVSPKLRKYYDPTTIDYAGFKMDIFGFPYIIGGDEVDDNKYNRIREAMPTGTVLLIKKSIFDEVKGFDERFVMLNDDLDLSWRVRLLGYRSMINPFAIVYHKSRGTLKHRKRWTLRYHSEKNIIRMLLKNYALATLSWVLPLYSILFLGEFLFYVFILRWDMAWAIVKAVLWNYFNILSTLKLRAYVQTHRKVSDEEILKHRAKGSYKLGMFVRFLRKDYRL